MPLKHHGQDLYRLGISYFKYGTMRTGRKVNAYTYTLCTAPTEEQVEALRQLYPHAKVYQSRYLYAPELCRPTIVIPSAAALKRAASV